MPSQAFDEFLVFVYFAYGLSFFGMGLTLVLESERLPSLVEARLLRPLAAFGMIHGTHEWLESYLLQSQIGGLQLPGWISWLRLGTLLISFLVLLIFGIWSLSEYPLEPRWQFYAAMGILLAFCIGILVSAFVTYRAGAVSWATVLDGLIRYLIAVPAALLAALALRAQTFWSGEHGQMRLQTCVSAASVGFLVYAAAQVFVPPQEMFPANLLNTVSFREVTGLPIQLVRMAATIPITVGMVRLVRTAEKSCQEQILDLQKARLKALENIQTETKRRESMRRELLRHVVQAQEDERARIARELHDETSQALAAFSIDLATLQMVTPQKQEVKQLIDRLQELSKRLSQGLYRLVHDLRPAQLDDLGLVAALQYLADQDARSKGLDVRLDVQGTVRRLDPVVETVLFRVTQEALANVARHAQTKQACVSLTYQARDVTLTIADAGVGFDPAQSFLPPRGWGLTGMRERVEAVGGQLTIHSAPGKGTQVEVTVDVFDLIP